MNDFENELKRQAIRRVPEHWRAQILAAAESQGSAPSADPPWWVALLWPSPKAWGALAAAWVVMLGFAAATRESGFDAGAPEATQVRIAMEEKRRLQAEIEEASLRLDPQPKPRSARIVESKTV